MKTILLSSVLSAVAIAGAFASHVHSALSLRMYDGRPISVMVDGRLQGPAAAQHEILNLSPGVHRVKVYAVQNRNSGWGHTGMTPVFRGNVEIFSGYIIYAFVDRFNQLVIEEYEALAPPVFQGPGHLPGYSPYPTCPAYPGGFGYNGSQCSNNTAGGWNSGYGFNQPMRQTDFNDLLRVINSKSFESTKQDIAMGAIAGNYFTSEQIRQLLHVFTFESTKLEVAKQAYGKVVDPDRFYLVYDSFTFESSINSLQASIR